jgi:hypothetical protein
MIAVLWPVVSWLLRSVVLKFAVYTVLFLIVTESVQFLTSYLPTGDGGLSSSLGRFTPEMWYFFDLFQCGVTIPMILSAYVLRFSIRRIPFIG